MIVRVAVQPPSLDDLGNWNHLDALGKSLDDVFWTRCGLYSLEGVESVRAHEQLRANRLRRLQVRQGAGTRARFVGWRVRKLELHGRIAGSEWLLFNPVSEGQGTGLAQAFGTLYCTYVGWINTLPELAASSAQLTVERVQTFVLVEKGGGAGRSGGEMHPWRIRFLFLPVVRAQSLGRLQGDTKGHNWCQEPPATGLWQRRA